MNQSLINELRALEVQIRQQLNKLEERPGAYDLTYYLEKTKLLAARANVLNGIAVLVAANKR